MRPGVLIPLSHEDPTGFTILAEELGYDSAWMPELWGASSVVHLTDIAAATEEITLGTAILNVFSRTPAVLAMTAATLSQVSDGRFTLGVGTSTRKAVEDLHGLSWDDPNPVRRAHETIDLVKAFLAEEGRVEYDGQVFEVQDFPALDADVPVYHAALGKANRRVVARLCDGWIPHMIPFSDLDDSFAYVAEHAEKAGRDPSDITVAPYVPSAVSEDGEEARDAVRGHIAYYTGSGEGYQRAVATRFPEGAEKVAELWRSGERGEATAAVTDEMLAALGVAGTPEEAREQFEAIAALDAVDRPLVTLPNNATHLAEGTAEALAESF